MAGSHSRKQIKALQREFIDWLVDPQKEGTQEQWAKDHGVHFVTVSRWKREPQFVAAWYDRLHDLDVNPDRVQSVVDAMLARAQTGDTRAAKLYLDYVSQFTPQKSAMSEAKQLASLSDRELRELLGEVVEDELDRRRVADEVSDGSAAVAVEPSE